MCVCVLCVCVELTRGVDFSPPHDHHLRGGGGYKRRSHNYLPPLP